MLFFSWASTWYVALREPPTPLAGETSCLSWASAYHSSCHGHGAVGLATTFRLGGEWFRVVFQVEVLRGLDVGRKLGSMVRISGLQPQLYSFNFKYSL